jgi:hypothetical protein
MFSFFEKNDFYAFIMKNFLKVNHVSSFFSFTLSGVKASYFKNPALNNKPVSADILNPSLFK